MGSLCADMPIREAEGQLRASRRPCATVDGVRHLEAGSRTGIGRGAAGLSCIRFVPHLSIDSMLCGLKRASLSAGGDMGPNRLRQTRAESQYGTFWSRGSVGEPAVTLPLLILSLLTGPNVASLAEVATVRHPVLHRGRGGLQRFRAVVYRPPRAAGSGPSMLGAARRVPVAEHQSKVWV